MAAVEVLSKNPEQTSSDESTEMIVHGHSVKDGDTIIFEVLRTDKKHEQIKVIVAGVEHRQFLKFVGEDKRLYQILPAQGVWQGDTKSNAIAVAYLDEPPRLLFLGPSQHNSYRSHGIAAERTVVDVSVTAVIRSEPIEV